jgi:hypothetical protein
MGYQDISTENDIMNKYFKRIEEKLNSIVMELIENMLDAAKENEWEAVLLSCGAIMDNVKTIQPQAAGNIHKVISGKGEEEFYG